MRARGQAPRGAGTPEYVMWKGMIDRCHLPTSTDYRNHGAIGIRVCDEWRESFWTWFCHIGPRPSAAHSIDRIDPFGDYRPGNVRWATRNTRKAKGRQHGG